MNCIFADTSFYVAFLRRDDAASQNALALAAKFKGDIVTSDYVLLELANWFARSTHRHKFLRFYRHIHADEKTTIVAASRATIERGIELYSAMSDKGWSLTDCISFDIMRSMDLRAAATTDRHFIQAGFDALLIP